MLRIISNNANKVSEEEILKQEAEELKRKQEEDDEIALQKAVDSNDNEDEFM